MHFLTVVKTLHKTNTISKKWHNVRRLVTSFRILKVFLKDTLYVWIRLCLKSIQLITSGHSKCRSQQFILLFQMFYKLMPNCCYYISLLIFSVTDEGCSNSLCSVQSLLVVQVCFHFSLSSTIRMANFIFTYLFMGKTIQAVRDVGFSTQRSLYCCRQIINLLCFQ